MILEMSFRGNGNSVYVDVLEGIDVVRLLSGEIWRWIASAPGRWERNLNGSTKETSNAAQIRILIVRLTKV